MKRAVIALLALVLMACACHVMAGDQPASREDVVRMLNAIGMQQQAERMQTVMLQQVKETLPVADDEHLTPAQRARMQDITARMLADIMTAYPPSDAINDLVPIYQKHFTKSDVDAITAFYWSPSGRKFVEKTPEIMGEFMAVLMPQMQAKIKPIIDKYQKEMEGATRKTGKPEETTPKM
jgi:hypothetical protein